MSFTIGLSGIGAANSELSITSNNIANAGTVGFKRSRAEFADIYSSNRFNTSNTVIGSGVSLNIVRQLYNQGGLEYTSGDLDFAINGPGFFTTSSTPDIEVGELSYTRAGTFNIDADGYVVSPQGRYLQAFPVNNNNSVTTFGQASGEAIFVPPSSGTPNATTLIEMGANLSADTPSLPLVDFDPDVSTSYNGTTSITLYDSLGLTHNMQTFFIKTAPNTWETRTYVDGIRVAPTGAPAAANATSPDETLIFSESGVFQLPADGLIDYAPLPLNNGALELNFATDFSPGPGPAHSTQYSYGFEITQLGQDGSGAGLLSGLQLDLNGTLRASYTNGNSVPLGRLMMADFSNPAALRKLGETEWEETPESGNVQVGTPGIGRFGTVRAGALEGSNVELTNELVKLITSQRNFQASAKSIETSNAVTQTIINI